MSDKADDILGRVIFDLLRVAGRLQQAGDGGVFGFGIEIAGQDDRFGTAVEDFANRARLAESSIFIVVVQVSGAKHEWFPRQVDRAGCHDAPLSLGFAGEPMDL